jgi:F420-dependent oxidoreductase-like protein
MSVGVGLPAGDARVTTNAVDELVRQVREAADAGVASAWFTQLFDHDAIMVAALAGRAVPGITVGTGVVPLYPRHPLVIASAAQTAQAATDGRFVLGVGMGVPSLLEAAYGLEYPPPVAYLRECLAILRGTLAGNRVDFAGELVDARPPMPTAVAGGGGVPVIAAAMGPLALRAAGELCDGTMPFLAGPRTLATRIVPVITGAAQAAGRPAPRIIATVPALVTSDVKRATEIMAAYLGAYGQIPSYQRVLATEGASHPVELALIGDEEAVAAGIRRYFETGATDVVLVQSGLRSGAERLRTWQLAGELSRSSR